jgi:LysM repeat protein/ABC-type branched-subunit amino acid transport system substrate-binding protein
MILVQNLPRPSNGNNFLPETMKPRFISALSFLLLLACIVCTSSLSAQTKGAIEEINGTPFYMHTIEKGQTLYAISKLYQCDMNAILSANPGIESGLKEGELLKVPAPVSTKKVIEIQHTVEKKETLYSIAKKYDVDINAIIALNPGVDKMLSKGQVLRIPMKKGSVSVPELPRAENPMLQANSKQHIVQIGETLFSIARQYGSSVDAILGANPGLNENLKEGQTIVIPTRALPISPAEKLTEKPTSAPQPNKPLHLEGDIKKESYNIALMLPFMTNEEDTIGLTDKEKKLRDVAVNLYRGALLAFDTLKKEGFRGEIFVYDVADDKYAAQKILQGNDMKNADLIFGPAFREPLQEVGQWGAKNGVHVVCPVPQSNRVLLSSPNMSKAYPSEATQWEAIAKFIAKEYKGAQVTVVNTTDVDDLKNLTVFHTAFFEASGDSAAEFKASTRTLNGIAAFMKGGGTQVVVIPSDDKYLVTTMFGQLKGDNVVLFGPESWENMEMIQADDRVRTHIHHPKVSYIDLNDKRSFDLYDVFRRKYKSEPSEYAFLGYNMMLYYCRGLQDFGREFPNHFHEMSQNGLCSWGFSFLKTGQESGFENKHVFIVQSSESGYELVNPK